jgi:hypothetical protein
MVVVIEQEAICATSLCSLNSAENRFSCVILIGQKCFLESEYAAVSKICRLGGLHLDDCIDVVQIGENPLLSRF